MHINYGRTAAFPKPVAAGTMLNSATFVELAYGPEDEELKMNEKEN